MEFPRSSRTEGRGCSFRTKTSGSWPYTFFALLGDPRMAAELGDSARRFVEAQFTTKQFASSMNEVYSQLLGS